MTRREFFERMALLIAGLSLPRRLVAQSVSPARPDSALVPPPPPAGPNSVWLAAAGDTTLGFNLQDHFDQQLAAGMTKEQLWPLYFAGVRPMLDAADVALVNLECPFTERGRKLTKNFNFRARPDLVKILEAGSVDLVTLANNHLMDYGQQGLEDTLLTLQAAGIDAFGAGEDLAEARTPAIVVRNGLRLGFLGYYFQAPPDMLEPKAVYATPNSGGVAGVYQDLPGMMRQLDEDLTRLLPTVDVAIPFFHWGKEGSTEVRDYQIALAHHAVDRGCKAVLGAHPHRLQGVEIYKDAPIFYSLGNFVFGGNKDPKDKLSAIARIHFDKVGAIEAELVPIQITRWPEAPFQPFLLEGAAKDDALARIADLSREFPATLRQLVPYRQVRPTAIAPADSSLAPADSTRSPR
jgi:poly-gamma-glutamate capsule biosynthesis protein CapA/YwtB (metallophosphatase superfamily)